MMALHSVGLTCYTTTPVPSSVAFMFVLKAAAFITMCYDHKSNPKIVVSVNEMACFLVFSTMPGIQFNRM